MMAGDSGRAGLRHPHALLALGASAFALAALAVCLLICLRPEGAADRPEGAAAVPSVGPDATGASIAARADPAVLGRVTVPAVCDGARLVETAGEGMGVRATWSLDASVEDVARSVLAGYEAMEGVHLGDAEYIDLYGCVWSCVVSSAQGWSETVLVDGRGSDEDASSCQLTVMRLQASSEADGAFGVDGAIEAAVASGLAAAAQGGEGEGR